MDTIKLKRATKSIANASTKVLEKDEVLVVTPDSGSGKGKCQLKFGDGVTAAKSLPIAIDGENADEMKVSTIPTVSDENPVLSAGETVKVLFGKIKKKFTYLENLVGNVKSVTNLFGSTDAKTVAQGLQILVNTKLSKTDKYDGVDSTSTELWATANAVRKVNEKSDNNSTSIRELNSNLENGLRDAITNSDFEIVDVHTLNNYAFGSAVRCGRMVIVCFSTDSASSTQGKGTFFTLPANFCPSEIRYGMGIFSNASNTDSGLTNRPVYVDISGNVCNPSSAAVYRGGGTIVYIK